MTNVRILDAQMNKLMTVKELSLIYKLAPSTVEYRIKHNIPLTAPLANPTSSSKMKKVWVNRKQEMAEFIANMDKRKNGTFN